MSNGEWVVCPLNGAEGFWFKGKVYSFALFTAAINRFAPRELDPIISLRVEVDRWVKVASSDFDVFGIEPVKWVRHDPIEIVQSWEWREKSGKTFLCFEVDSELIEKIKGDKFRLTEVLE